MARAPTGEISASRLSARGCQGALGITHVIAARGEVIHERERPGDVTPDGSATTYSGRRNLCESCDLRDRVAIRRSQVEFYLFAQPRDGVLKGVCA